MCLDCAGVVGSHVHPSLKEVKKVSKNNDFFDLFGDTFPRWQKWPPRCVQRVPKGCPGGPKCRPGSARCRPRMSACRLFVSFCDPLALILGSIWFQMVPKMAPRCHFLSLNVDMPTHWVCMPTFCVILCALGQQQVTSNKILG